ncbi:MAG: hypothetical protein ACR2ME_05960, partial [Acidimicrobiia bacterium]
VRLFTVYSDELEALSRGSITLRGEGPIGTFRAGGDPPNIEVTSVLDTAIAGADLIVISGPVLKQRTYALVMAPYIRDGQILAVIPGRTFGGLELLHTIRTGGSRADLRIVEFDDLPFDIEDSGTSITLTRRRAPRVAVLPHAATSTLDRLRPFFPDLMAMPTILDTSLGADPPTVEVPTLLLGGRATPANVRSIPPGAVPISSTTFRGLIGPAHLRLISELAAERRAVAKAFGVRDLPDDETWVDQIAGSQDGERVRAVPSEDAAAALVRNGVLGSLEPLISAAEAAGVSAPVTQSVIAVAEAAMGADLSAPTLDRIGLGGRDANEVRALLMTDAISLGHAMRSR